MRSTSTESARASRLEDRRALALRKSDRRLQILERGRQPCSGRSAAVAERAIGLVGQREARLVIELGDDRVELGLRREICARNAVMTSRADTWRDGICAPDRARSRSTARRRLHPLGLPEAIHQIQIDQDHRRQRRG
jgi:hypothetical protein